jgi:hypothetical protein
MENGENVEKEKMKKMWKIERNGENREMETWRK